MGQLKRQSFPFSLRERVVIAERLQRGRMRESPLTVDRVPSSDAPRHLLPEGEGKPKIGTT